MGMCASVQAPGALRASHVMCSTERKRCHSESPFLMKAVTDKISSYLKPKQDILEVCNWKGHEREDISDLHYSVAAFVCARAMLPGAASQALFLRVTSSQCSGGRVEPQTPHSSAQRSAVLLGAAAQGCVLGLDVAVWEHMASWCCSGGAAALGLSPQ